METIAMSSQASLLSPQLVSVVSEVVVKLYREEKKKIFIELRSKGLSYSQRSDCWNITRAVVINIAMKPVISF